MNETFWHSFKHLMFYSVFQVHMLEPCSLKLSKPKFSSIGKYYNFRVSILCVFWGETRRTKAAVLTSFTITLLSTFWNFRVRCRAAYILAEVVNKLPETWLGPPALMILFKKFFGCKSAPHIPKPNNFVATSANLQLYFLMHVSSIYFCCLLFILPAH